MWDAQLLNPFSEIKVAAESLGVSWIRVDEVTEWDGKDDLEEDTSGIDTEDESSNIYEDDVLKPPETVRKIYEEATPALHTLGPAPDDVKAIEQLRGCNSKIASHNEDYNKAVGDDEGKKINKTQWEIPIAFFQTHYKQIWGLVEKLKKEPKNRKAKLGIFKTAKLIRQMVAKHHFPEKWLADPNPKPDDKPAPQPNDKQQAATPTVNSSLKYPWITLKVEDGPLIIGVRKIGKGGTQVCTEATENGHVVRRLQSASEVGLRKVEQYRHTKNHKNLADGQSKWSYRNRLDFKELHWVTLSYVKNKNLAAGRRNPPADCCVEFHSEIEGEKIHMLTLSSLTKILGVEDMRKEIERVCKRDDIDPPWELNPLATHYDLSKLEKDPEKRRELRRKQAEASVPPTTAAPFPPTIAAPAQPSHEADDDRLKRLETMVRSLSDMVKSQNENFTKLQAMFEQFMPKPGTTESSIFVDANATGGE